MPAFSTTALRVGGGAAGLTRVAFGGGRCADELEYTAVGAPAPMTKPAEPAASPAGGLSVAMERAQLDAAKAGSLAAMESSVWDAAHGAHGRGPRVAP